MSRYHELLAQCGNAKLIVVSKNHPWSECQPLYEDGARNFAENRVQIALPKQSEAPSDIAWHFIGPLQTNKVHKVIGAFQMIHSVDDLPLAERISEASLAKGIVTPILLQVNTSGEKAKQGNSPETWEYDLDQAATLRGVSIRGLMTMAPLTDDKQGVRSCFRRLREWRDDWQKRGNLALSELSMGMSHDYLIALEEGATMVRIGSALF